MSEPRLDGWVDRPWGGYRVVHQGTGHQVKVLIVEPNQEMSLQLHRHRSEHLIVLSGRVQARLGDVTHEYGPGESLHVPVGEKHRIGNPGDLPLHLVEAQLGDDIRESDIERFEDRYGRV